MFPFLSKPFKLSIMKEKLYPHIGTLSMLSLVFLLLSFSVVAQDFTDTERLERCQNNKNRLAELEKQLKVVDEDLSNVWTKKEIEDARDKMVLIRKFRINGYDAHKEVTLNRIAAQYNFKYIDCCSKKLHTECLENLEQIIAKKIDKATSLSGPELLNKKKDIEKQIASHRTNIIALRCNEKKVSNADDADYIKLSGTWRSGPGPRIGELQLNVSRSGSVSGKSKGGNILITITGGDYRPTSMVKTLRVDFVEESSKRTGHGSLTFLEGKNEYVLSGKFRYAGVGEYYEWEMTKEK